MRARGVITLAVVPVSGLIGCTLLTEIPEDAASGRADGASGVQDGAPRADAGAHDDGSVIPGSDSGGTTTPDASSDTGGPPSSGAVTLDAVGPSSFGAGGNNKTSPLVWSHTTSGTNRALFVNLVINADPDSAVAIGAVKYEGTALTLVGMQHSNNKNSGYTQLWALVNPPAGAHPVSIEFTGDPEPILAGSISFQGVDQTTPFQNVTKAGGDGNKAMVSASSANGDMVIASVVGACDIAPPDGVRGWLRNVTCADGAGNGAASAFTDAPNVDVVYGIDSDWWGIVAADVKAAKP